jgi:hypothetical protein
MGKALITGLAVSLVSGLISHFASTTESPAVIGAAYGFLIFLAGHAMGSKDNGSRSEHNDGN